MDGQIHEMDGRMNGQKDEWMVGLNDEQMDGCIHVHVYMNRNRDGNMNGCKNRWMGELLGEWMDGLMNG